MVANFAPARLQAQVRGENRDVGTSESDTPRETKRPRDALQVPLASYFVTRTYQNPQN